MSSSGSGRSAGARPASGGVMTWPTPTRTGVRGSRAMDRAAYRLHAPGVPWLAGRLGPHARRRRLGSRRVRPQGDLEGRAGRARPRGRATRAPTRPQAVDYPDFGALVGRAVAGGSADLGICVCGTGNGIAMAANKIPGVRAAVIHDVTTATLARRHNHANVVCVGRADDRRHRGRRRADRLPRRARGGWTPRPAPRQAGRPRPGARPPDPREGTP